jgi:uncharacterized protein YjbI with pentapeptide repeats
MKRRPLAFAFKAALPVLIFRLCFHLSEKSSLSGGDGRNCPDRNAEGRKMEIVKGTKRRLDVHDADLSGSKFDDVNMSGWTVHNVNMSGLRIDYANLAGLHIHNANLAGACLTECRVEGMSINGVALVDLFAAYEKHKLNQSE